MSPCEWTLMLSRCKWILALSECEWTFDVGHQRHISEYAPPVSGSACGVILVPEPGMFEAFVTVIESTNHRAYRVHFRLLASLQSNNIIGGKLTWYARNVC